MKERNRIYRISAVGVLAAMVFIANFFSIPLPFEARIHFGNTFCVLAGLLLGPVSGGLCAGLGGFFYDLCNPLYAAEAPITFALKFLLGFLTGAVAFHGGKRSERFPVNLLAAAAGSAGYVAAYLIKNFIEQTVFLRNPIETALTVLAVKGGSSIVNGILAVAAAMVLRPVFIGAMRAAGIDQKIFPQ